MSWVQIHHVTTKDLWQLDKKRVCEVRDVKRSLLAHRGFQDDHSLLLGL